MLVLNKHHVNMVKLPMHGSKGHRFCCAFLGSAKMAQFLIGAVFFSSHDVSGLFSIPPEVPPEK